MKTLVRCNKFAIWETGTFAMMYSAEDESRANGSGSANPAFVSDDDTAPNGHLPDKPKVNPFSVQE